MDGAVVIEMPFPGAADNGAVAAALFGNFQTSEVVERIIQAKNRRRRFFLFFHFRLLMYIRKDYTPNKAG